MDYRAAARKVNDIATVLADDDADQDTLNNALEDAVRLFGQVLLDIAESLSILAARQ